MGVYSLLQTKKANFIKSSFDQGGLKFRIVM